ncbi:MAG: hypothetical protein R3A44_18005 [Caldilineaceae bacterium]
MNPYPNVKALTFDLFGTILDLGGSLTPYIAEFLQQKGSSADPAHFWAQWRARQRIEQYQDTIIDAGPQRLFGGSGSAALSTRSWG